MPKAIIVSPNGVSDSGGVERVMLYVQRILGGLGYETVILDRRRLRRSVVGRYLLPAARGGIDTVVEGLAFSRLAASLRRPGDLVIANGYSSPFIRSDLLFCHGSIRGFRLSVKGRDSLYSPPELLEACAGFLARTAVAVSRRAGEEWRRMYRTPAGRIQVLQNCVDARAFSPRTAGRRAWPGGEVRVLYVARLGPQKAPERVLRLIEYAETTGASVRFVVATPSRENTRGFERSSRVDLNIGVAFRDLPELYRSCDVLFVPSRYEGFEMVTLEALASGTPVVGSDVGGISELTRQGFPGVRVVDPDDLPETLDVLMESAGHWADFQRKRELNEQVDREYGLDRWGSRLTELIRSLHAR